MDIDTTVLRAFTSAPGAELSAALKTRANILQMTEAAEDAVLRPRENGAFSHELRSAFASRIASLNGELDLAARYISDAGSFAAIADPKADGMEQGLSVVLAFMDKVAARTRDVTDQDITAVQAAGISDADIVRLAELNAFLSYQMRLLAGLRLIGQGAQ